MMLLSAQLEEKGLSSSEAQIEAFYISTGSKRQEGEGSWEKRQDS